MKLSISNIAWDKYFDEEVYAFMKKEKYIGLEIAPTRICNKSPYDDLDKAIKFKGDIDNKYNFIISSMQSIWFGRNEKLFGSDEDRKILMDYTRKAIDYADVIGCKNIVFGCPKNRVIGNENIKKAIDFFKEIGEYANKKSTIVSIEPNPIIYETDFINYTEQAFELVKAIKSNEIKVNIDVGTMIQNQEDVNIITENINQINHVHISEPYLEPIKRRNIHLELAKILRNKYTGFVSIEMKKQEDVSIIKDIMLYVKEVFA